MRNRITRSAPDLARFQLTNHSQAAETARRRVKSELAFMFADLVGFTAYTEERGDDAAADLALSFCHEICELNRGHQAEDVKMIGDACLIHAPDATIGIDLGLHIVDRIGPEHGFPGVRVGVDWGSAAERDGDWFGTTINVASRIVALAPEGALLVTERVREAATHLVGVSLIDQGARELRGLRDPIRLFIAERTKQEGP